MQRHMHTNNAQRHALWDLRNKVVFWVEFDIKSVTATVEDELPNILVDVLLTGISRSMNIGKNNIKYDDDDYDLFVLLWLQQWTTAYRNSSSVRVF